MKTLFLVLGSLFFSSLFATTYTNDQSKYSIEYPSDWVKNDKIEGFDLFIMAPTSDKSGSSLANISIISGDLPPDVNLDLYYSENMRQLKEMAPIEIKGEGTTTVAGQNAKWVRYLRNDDKTEIMHTFFIANGRAYLFTCGADQGSFDTYKSVCDNVVKSFKLK